MSRHTNKTQRIIIVGAGISGLALGWFLRQRFAGTLSLTILEATERPGGWIRSHQKQDFLFEEGPRSCRSKGAGMATFQLAEDLGIAEEVIEASPSARKRFLYVNGQLQAAPDSLFSFLRSPLTRGVLPALWKEWRVPPSTLDDESIAAFIGRRLSSDLADRLVDPLISGIYAGDIERLSVRSCFPEWHQREQQHGSLLKGMWDNRHIRKEAPAQLKSPIFSFKHGMETLITALHRGLKNEIRLGCPVQEIVTENSHLKVKIEDGEILEADQVFLAIPASATARLVEKEAPFLAHEMLQSKTATVGVVCLGWKRDDILPHQGFGYLIPSSEREDILGVVFDSSVFPQQNRNETQTRLTVMMGGTHHPEIEKASACQLQDQALATLQRHLGIKVPPDAVHAILARHAIPQYEMGHHARLLKIEQGLGQAFASRLTLLGSAWRGVAVNDCIAEAKKLAGHAS